MKKKKTSMSFDPSQIKAWEDSDGVNFAIALARITGWLLHVDWWSTNQGNEPVEEMKSLRVYVADDQDNIFDVRGKQKIASFNQQTILPIAKKRAKGNGGILTRYYSEEKIFELPLRVKPDPIRIASIEEMIKSNTTFLEKIPVRKFPFIPAYLAADYSFGRCAIYANAMHDLTNLPVTGIVANEYTPLFANSKIGYAHSIILHEDDIAEDAWGKQSLSRILGRYGIEKYSLNEMEHVRITENLKRNSSDKYQEAYAQTIDVIRKYLLK